MHGIRNRKVVKKLPDSRTTLERDLADLAAHYARRIVAYFAFAF
jgi:hypothetical protein